MTPSQYLSHLLNFLWPAFAVAVGLSLVLSWRFGHSWWRQCAALSLLGALVLIAGLLLLQRDGAMATYAAMLVLQATWSWWAARRHTSNRP